MAKIKEKRNNVFISLICIFIICASIISSVNNYSEIRKKNREKQELIKLLEELSHEEKTLEDDVEKLKNPEYAARYAREKYLYSKTDEKILKID